MVEEWPSAMFRAKEAYTSLDCTKDCTASAVICYIAVQKYI